MQFEPEIPARTAVGQRKPPACSPPLFRSICLFHGGRVALTLWRSPVTSRPKQRPRNDAAIGRAPAANLRKRRRYRRHRSHGPTLKSVNGLRMDACGRFRGPGPQPATKNTRSRGQSTPMIRGHSAPGTSVAGRKDRMYPGVGAGWRASSTEVAFHRLDWIFHDALRK